MALKPSCGVLSWSGGYNVLRHHLTRHLQGSEHRLGSDGLVGRQRRSVNQYSHITQNRAKDVPQLASIAAQPPLRATHALKQSLLGPRKDDEEPALPQPEAGENMILTARLDISSLVALQAGESLLLKLQAEKSSRRTQHVEDPSQDEEPPQLEEKHEIVSLLAPSAEDTLSPIAQTSEQSVSRSTPFKKAVHPRIQQAREHVEAFLDYTFANADWLEEALWTYPVTMCSGKVLRGGNRGLAQIGDSALDLIINHQSYARGMTPSMYITFRERVHAF